MKFMNMVCRPDPERSRAWSAKVLLKYTLLQIPGLGLLIFVIYFLRARIHLPSWAIWLICLLWIAKDVILYPFVWRAYDGGGDRDGDDLVGKRAVTKGELSPIGYVEVSGELWQAQLKDTRSTVHAGRPVRILSRKGLTLTVEPLENLPVGAGKGNI